MVQKADPPIVAIGASAGGVQALQTFFDLMPIDTGATFVVIVHLDPHARSELANILAARTRMPVTQVEDQARLESNHVYVIAPNRRLKIADGTIAALPFEEPHALRAPIDFFFRSLAKEHRSEFAIILTGAGADGAIGVKAIKEADGIVLVQDPDEAEYASMPRNAIATEVADFVLPIRELPHRLAELLARRDQLPSHQFRVNDDEMIGRIMAHVRGRTGHDFSQYKRATILRRIGRRAQVARRETFADYYNYLRENPEEAQALFSDFLISVTTFFRDPSAFEVVAERVIPHLFDGKEVADKIRVWVPGCATGEEAYTIGILLLEEAARRDLSPEIQVFGSDLDEQALRIAREGRYPSTVEGDLSEERLRRFFQREGDHYRVRRDLRDAVLFASHSLLRDPPFSHLDMISCRNLLIYLDRQLQQQVCNTFHYALNAGGFLFLGSSESADYPGLFRPVDRETRIYKALAGAGARPMVLPALLGPHKPEMKSTIIRTPPAGHVSDAAVHRQMLEKIAPPSMLVDESHHAIHLSENAGRFLKPSGGPVSTAASDLVREEFRFDLRAALHRAFGRSEPTLSMPILADLDGQPHRVYLQVKPVVQGTERTRHALVLFIEGEAIDKTQEVVLDTLDGRPTIDEAIRRLQEELQLAQNRLRLTSEESDTATEELRAANEELQSMNEEYRSTAEELETSKEELQSINEELQTVNNELKLKLESISRANSDLQNLMAATDIATLFLDPSLRIKRFTPRLMEIFNVTPNDEGRPITDFTHHLQYKRLSDDARAVLETLRPVEHEVKGRNDGWYLVRMRPYRTIEDKIDGVVVTFVDISERRHAEEAAKESGQRLEQEMRLVELSRSPIFVWDFDDGVMQWNRGSEELYGYSREEALGRRKEELLKTGVPGSSFDKLRRTLSQKGRWSGELNHTTKDGRVLTVESQIELVPFGERRFVLESTRDITDRKRWERRGQLLLNELSHRVKNTLAVVQSLARQTLRTTRSSEDFVERFEGRLAALASAHKLLVDSEWSGAELNELARRQLDAYAASDRRRLQIEGEPVTLPPDLATPFGLVLHELATNAAKYGAFSTGNGQIKLSWKLGNNGRSLGVIWQERGGPPVEPPSEQGFGGVLIEKSLPGSTVHRDFQPDGVVCTIDIELPEIRPDGGEK
ncbi:PAS domain S-box protein [Sinorhizobium medicae]|nr:PAS domain S-box protein [Sinorhizobium medicae]MDX0876756.1 PAS domain S-box protein [Sinorhizobium medicae]MDX0953092.1 PAS domain S-box protein [Sinorhizobium medicae]MDX1066069.1 PAS domain S-box protein [Sinorhizobium medicae]